MHDCHEAMVKIKMAFKPDKSDGLVLVDMDPSKKSENNVVSNFGEYYTQEGLLVEPVLLMDPNEEAIGGNNGFAIPFSLDPNGVSEGENWIMAEEDEVEDGRGRKKKSTIDATLTLGTGMNRLGEEEEEGWGVFDPDADMRDDDDEDMHVFQPDEELEGNIAGGGRESMASRVELVRGVGDSVASDHQLQVRWIMLFVVFVT